MHGTAEEKSQGTRALGIIFFGLPHTALTKSAKTKIATFANIIIPISFNHISYIGCSDLPKGSEVGETRTNIINKELIYYLNNKFQ